MTEGDYIAASNLAKLRLAHQALSDLLFMGNDPEDPDVLDKSKALRAIDAMTDRGHAEVSRRRRARQEGVLGSEDKIVDAVEVLHAAAGDLAEQKREVDRLRAGRFNPHEIASLELPISVRNAIARALKQRS